MLNMTHEADTNRIRNIALQDDDEMKIIYMKIQRTVNHQCMCDNIRAKFCSD